MTQRYRKARIAHFRLYFYRRYQNWYCLSAVSDIFFTHHASHLRVLNSILMSCKVSSPQMSSWMHVLYLSFYKYNFNVIQLSMLKFHMMCAISYILAYKILDLRIEQDKANKHLSSV